MRESRKRKAVSYAESASGDGDESGEDAASSEAEEMNSNDSESDDSMDADGSSEDDLDAEEESDDDVVGSDDDGVKHKSKGKQAPKGAPKTSKSAPKAASRPKASPARAKSAATSSVSKKSPVSSSRTATTGGVSINQGSSSTSAIGSASVTTGVTIGVTNASSTGVDITQGPPITTDAGAKKLVTQYMRQQNRPYSAQQIFDNLHKRIPKATLERVLGVLSGPGEGLLCKEYGKAKIYYVDQSFLPAERSAEQLQDLQQSVLELQDELKVQLQEEKDKKQLLQARRAEPDDNELDRLVHELEERIRGKRQKVEALQAGKVSGPQIAAKKGSKQSGPMSLEQATQQFNLKRKAWVERKSLCMNAIDVLSEALSKKRQEILTMLDIETDEACGAVLPPKL